MKSLNTNTKKGCPFNREMFTNDVVKHILDEGFEWRNSNDSYAEYRGLEVSGCYKKYEDGNGFDIFIYICEDGIEVDQDYDCGGNLNTQFIPYGDSFEEAYDTMVDSVNRIKSR